MPRAYEDHRLYGPKCSEQPNYFYEVRAWQVNEVTPDGTVVRNKDREIMECWECESTAVWGWELNRGI